MSDFEHGCQYCYYEFFDSRAYPCSMCIYGEERTDKFQPKGKQNKRTEPNCSEKPNNAFDKDINVRSKNCETCKHNKLEWFSEVCDGCSKAHSNYEPKDEHSGEVTEMVEPQTDIEIARAIVHKAIDDTPIAEDAYPDLRQKMHDAVDSYEPQTEDKHAVCTGCDYYDLPNAFHPCASCVDFSKYKPMIEDEPQTERDEQ